MDRIDAILSRVLRPIPPPYRPPPRPRASWAKLKPGDVLELRLDWFSGTLGSLVAGDRLLVASTDSEGMTLTLGGLKTWRWEASDWSETFTKLTKRQLKSKGDSK